MRRCWGCGVAEIEQVQQIISDAHAAGRTEPRELARYLLDHLVIAVPDTEATTTRRDFPPLTVRAAALIVAIKHLGEAEEGGENLGPIVVWSLEGFGEKPPQLWCAFFISQCYRRVLLDSGPEDDHLLKEWMGRLASGSCDDLWKRLGDRAWTWLRTAGRTPDPGDLVFFGVATDLHHVEFVERVEVVDGVVWVHTVGGNSGDSVKRNRYKLTDGRIYGYARIPW